MFNTFKDPKKHCEYFKYLSIVATVIAALLFALASFAISKKQYKEGATILVYAMFYMLSYFQNRLLYTMCKK
jgi:hypothetical protein